MTSFWSNKNIKPVTREEMDRFTEAMKEGWGLTPPAREIISPEEYRRRYEQEMPPAEGATEGLTREEILAKRRRAGL